MLLYALLIADGVLLISVLITATIRFCKRSDQDIKEEPGTNKILEEQVEADKGEDDSSLSPDAVQSSESDSVYSEGLNDTPEETLIIGDIEDDDAEKKDMSFSEKMLSLDKTVQGYYDTINNALLSFRRLYARVSQKCVAYRFGRDLVAKLYVRGKTLRFNLALNPKNFDEKIYFQKDMHDIKSYKDIPFCVKLKSDRGLKRALELIDVLAENKNIERKSRYTPVDSIKELKING